MTKGANTMTNAQYMSYEPIGTGTGVYAAVCGQKSALVEIVEGNATITVNSYAVGDTRKAVYQGLAVSDAIQLAHVFTHLAD
jgi:hypothetical protein